MTAEQYKTRLKKKADSIAELHYVIDALERKIKMQQDMLLDYEVSCRALRNTICVLENKKPI